MSSSILAALALSALATPYQDEVPPEPAPAPEPSPFGVQVRDFASDLPIGEALLRLEEVPGVVARSGRTNAEGKLRITGYPVGTSLQLVLSHPNYASRRLTHVVGGSEEYLRVYLLESATAAFRVPAEVVAGSSNATLRLESFEGTQTKLLLQDDAYAIPVNAEGLTAPAKVCFGLYSATLSVDGIDRLEWSVDLAPGVHDEPRTLEWKGGAFAITGLVRDDNAVPREGARVRLVAPDENAARVLTFTDAEGRFRYPALPAGRYRIQVMRRIARNYLDAQDLILHSRARNVFHASRIVELDAESPHADIRFGYDAAAVNVTGILLREHVPVPGWRVLLEDRATGDTWMSEFSRTDGLVEISGVRPNSELSVSYETVNAWIPGDQLVVGTAEREVHSLYVPPFSLEGQVFYEGTKLSPDEGRLIIESRGDGEARRWLAWLSPDGTFSVPGLRRGEYELWVQAPNCRGLRRRLVFDDAGSRELYVALDVELARRAR